MRERPIPGMRAKSAMSRNAPCAARSATMRSASTAPMPGRHISCSAVARFGATGPAHAAAAPDAVACFSGATAEWAPDTKAAPGYVTAGAGGPALKVTQGFEAPQQARADSRHPPQRLQRAEGPVRQPVRRDPEGKAPADARQPLQLFGGGAVHVHALAGLQGTGERLRRARQGGLAHHVLARELRRYGGRRRARSRAPGDPDEPARRRDGGEEQQRPALVPGEHAGKLRGVAARAGAA